MTNLFSKSLLRGAKSLPARLSELTETLQRSLTATPGHSGADLPSGLHNLDTAPLRARGADLLRGLNAFLPQGAPAKTAGRVQPALADMRAGQFSCDAGNRPYRLYVPHNLPRAPALLVMLHGCRQNAADFATGTRMNLHAESSGMLVLYPEQIQSANLQNCWNWFNPADQHRGRGEAAIIAGMTRAIIAEFGADPARIFVAGLSAGAAKAAVLGAAYPDLYHALGIHSGLACGAARDLPSALQAMRQGNAGSGKLTQPTIVFHGDVDSTVNVANADYIAAQANGTPPVRVEQGRSDGGLAYTRTIRAASGGQPALEEFRVHGLGHAWSGGDLAGSFTAPRGPDASREMLRFFREHS